MVYGSMAQSPKGEDERPAKRTKCGIRIDHGFYSLTRSYRYDYFDIVTVLVGPEETKFILPETIVCRESKFFQCACNGEWKEAAEKTVKLPEVQPHSFGVFFGWLNTEELDFSKSAHEDAPSKYDQSMSHEAFNTIVDRIVESFIIGDMLQSPRFCNTLVDELRRLVDGTALVPARPERHPSLFNELLQNSTIRRLVVDYTAFYLREEEFLKWVG